jgi:hypothetical protein
VPTRDRANEPMAFSLLANRMVSTWSEDWRHECEVAYLLDLPEKKRREMIDGIPGTTDSESKGIRGKRGEAQAAFLWGEVDRLGHCESNAAPASLS